MSNFGQDSLFTRALIEAGNNAQRSMDNKRYYQVKVRMMRTAGYKTRTPTYN